MCRDRLTIHDFVRLLSATPAKIFGLGQRKGRIQVGLDADLTITGVRVVEKRGGKSDPGAAR